jgi:lipoprotein
LTKSKALEVLLALCILIGCIAVVKIAKFVYEFNEKDSYIFDDSIVVNEYIEKIVKAFNTNDRELLASLFPEHARSKIDNFDKKIDRIIRENETWPSSIIRYTLDRNNNLQSYSDMGKVQRIVYANTTIEFADPKEGEVHRPSLTIGMEIIVVDDFNENNVGISIFAMGYEGFNNENVDKEKDGYDIYAFGR